MVHGYKLQLQTLYACCVLCRGFIYLLTSFYCFFMFFHIALWIGSVPPQLPTCRSRKRKEIMLPQLMPIYRTLRNLTNVSENSQQIRMGNVIKRNQHLTEIGYCCLMSTYFSFWCHSQGFSWKMCHFLLYPNDMRYEDCESAKCCLLMLAHPQRQ